MCLPRYRPRRVAAAKCSFGKYITPFLFTIIKACVGLPKRFYYW